MGLSRPVMGLLYFYLYLYNMEETGSGVPGDTLSTFAWRDQEKPREASVV
jgi:hypothetical protein